MRFLRSPGNDGGQIRLCQALVTIPTAGFSSLNLAQAVMVVCYELVFASVPGTGRKAPRLAGPSERKLLTTELDALLVDIGFQNPENPDYWPGRMQQFLDRLLLEAGEVALLRGVIRQVRRSLESGGKEGRAGVRSP